MEGHDENNKSNVEECENIVKKIDGEDLMATTSLGRTKSGEMREKLELKCFPPMLTTLSGVNGRPKFTLKKMVKDGRLTINMVRPEMSDISRCTRDDGRLRMWIVRDDNDDDDDDDDNFD